jgi:hypothetical protein
MRIEHIQRLIPPVVVPGEARPRLSARMAELHVPGVSIAVIHDGAIQWARGFGVARVGGPPVTAKTLFQAASISKPVTALAVLRLVQAGKLDLDTDVNGYLKSWKIPENTFTEEHPVTLRELLTHSAGVTVHGFPGYASGAPIPTLTQVLNGTPPANSPAIRVDTTPGTAWRYSPPWTETSVDLRPSSNDEGGGGSVEIRGDCPKGWKWPVSATHPVDQEGYDAIAVTASSTGYRSNLRGTAHETGSFDRVRALDGGLLGSGATAGDDRGEDSRGNQADSS